MDNGAVAGTVSIPDKAAYPLDWTSHMNGLKQQAEELALRELVYS
ncbi:hypothetical protein [Paenibacillus sp. SYP-B4298]|nr:hypothetical protein [Paenibacillus sp. SYP-B4298]